MNTRRYVTAPSHVAGCDLGPATVLVNYRTGGVHTLIGPSARWWAELAATGDPSAVSALDTRAANLLLDRLSASELLTDSPRPHPWPLPSAAQPWQLIFGTREAASAHAPIPCVPGRSVFVAVLALLVVLAFRHLGPTQTGMWRLLRLLGWASHCTVRPASPAQARQAVHAVRRATLLVPGRVACLEESVAAVLILAASRLRVTWCHGVAADPIRLHAWIESVDAQPVAEPPTTRQYTILRTIPERA